MPSERSAAQPQQSSLYRRHRPRTFEEVVGQEPVVRTLLGAVRRDQVHHAYLFVGSRGTGKTSMAKILAACLNCEHGPTVTPCGECDSCIAIARASSLDVIEMDAASNNSVDDIRELRDSVALAPVSGRRKVYILDEAHMLSTAAWNAFLKTLEEPPPNTVFVLATTEAQKVPATVVDRCHRFDFQRPTVEQLAQVLARTAQAESIEIGPEAIAALARAATGSFRDALGTLEQLLAYSGSEIALEDVLAVLGIADSALLERTVDAVAASDARGALLALAECADSGRDASSFASDLESRARELLLVQTLGEIPSELALTPESDARLLAQAERVPHATVVRLLELIGSALESVRAGADARTSLELALVIAARPEVDASTRALLARIERLEGGSAGAGAPSAPPIAGPTAARPPAPSVATSTPPPATPAPPAPAPTPPATSTPAGESPSAEGAPGERRLSDGRDKEPAADGPAREQNAPAATVPVVDPPPEPIEPVDAVAPVVEPPEDLQAVVELWPAVVELVGAGHALCGAVIADTHPVELAGEDLTVGFPTSAAFLKKKAEDPSNRQIVTDALRQLAGGRWRISYELREDLDEGGSGNGAPHAYTEEEWIERFKAELDAEEIPLDTDPDSQSEPGQPAVGGVERGA
ncbi:MAG TPA: DNA polymerase III subunit gamma/tau [Solirubrobacteraceae bacterium]|nr:DNA polymerase III subunit gamma/tau [Solirubrobacteraceae bacterium]